MSGICPACTGGEVRFWFTKSTRHGTYPIWRCRRCASAFVLPRPADDELERFYRAETYRVTDGTSPEERLSACTRAEARYPNSTLDATRIVTRCGNLANGTRFLDVGAGFGFFTREATRQGFRTTALEPAPNCREVFALMNGFEAIPSLLTPAFVQDYPGAFDAVLLSQVLEHVAGLDDAVAWIRALLADAGVAAIAVPHFGSLISMVQRRHDMFIDPPEHLNFLSRRGLIALFERHGFRCVVIETISRFDPSRIAARVPIGAAVVQALLSGALGMADRIGRGMYLNAYFRRT